MNEQSNIDRNSINTRPATALPCDPSALEQASDEALKELIATAQSLLASRDADRKREAIAKIKALAKANGLDVAIDAPKRRRGRKPKSEG